MASTATTRLRFEKQGFGDNPDTWGTTLNAVLDRVDEAIAGATTVSTTGGTTTLTDEDYIEDESRKAILLVSGTLASNSTIVIPALTKIYAVSNATSGSFTVTIKTSAGTGVVVPQGTQSFVLCDATDCFLVGVSGPASSTDNRVPRFDGTTGQVLQVSGIGIDDSDNVTGVANFSLSGNITVGGTVDGRDVAADGTKLDLITVTGSVDLDTINTKVGNISITQAVDLDAIETRVNALDAAVILQGTWDASTGSFPGSGSAQAGDSYIVSVGGTVDSVVFTANDRIVAITDNAATDTYAANWHKLDYTDVGDVAGPASSADNAVARYDSTTGKIIQNSGVTIDDSNNVAGVVNLTQTGYTDLTEISEPSSPASNTLRTYAVDNGGVSNFGIKDSAGNTLELSPNVQSLGLPGIHDGEFVIHSQYDDATGSGDNTASATLRIQRNDAYTGGSGLRYGIWSLGDVGANVAAEHWCILGAITNASTAGSNCVGVYGQGVKTGTSATWGMVAEGADETETADPSVGLYGIEIDVRANDTDANLTRRGIDIIGYRHNASGAKNHIGYGIIIQPQNGNNANAIFTNGIFLSKDFGVGINLSDADCTTADIITKGSVGFGTSAPDRRLHSEVADAVTNATTYAARLTHTTSGTAAASFGVGLEAEVESAGGNNRVIGALDWILTTATDTAEDAALTINLMDGGSAATEVARFASTGFLGINRTPAVDIDVAGGASTNVRVIANSIVDARLSASSASGVGFIGTFSNHDLVLKSHNTNPVRITGDANVKIGGAADRGTTEGTNQLVLFNGTAPAGTLANGGSIYAASGEITVMDAAGNATTISPHNFGLIPDGPSEDMAWSYHSKRDGKTINVDMLKAIRLIESLSGEKLVHIAETEVTH